MLSFDLFEKQENSMFPAQIDIKGAINGLSIRMRIEKINFGDTLTLDFIPGNNYNRVLLK
jgi:hypothetical protein